MRRTARRAEQGAMANYTAQLRAAVHARESFRRLAKRVPSPPVFAICVSSTSRGTGARALDDLALFSVMLPSLRESILAEQAAAKPTALLSNSSHASALDASANRTAPFEFWVYVAYDAGDAFYDRPEREAAVRAWLDTALMAPLAARGVTARHALLRYVNVLRKPGPVFNFMMASAYQDGADYLYRVNDDTRFAGAWAGIAAGRLGSFSPPNVGVVGPICDEGNSRILTHDLTHRTHMAIFGGVYYPPVFTDWWMDDWITRVYQASHRMARGPFRVQHLIGYQGTRYEVDQAHGKLLARELEAGERTISEWIHAHSPTTLQQRDEST
jgi:hypothetical protein